MREYNNQVIPDKSTALALDTNEQFIFQDGKWRKMTIKTTIEKAISHLGTYSSTMGSGQTTQEQHEESKRVAIDTMQKYQKIEEIYQKWNEVNDFSYKNAMQMIGDVIEDGKTD